MTSSLLHHQHEQSRLGLPALDLRALARRAALPGALAVVAAVALVVAGGPMQTFADALGRALNADPVWVGAAVAFELLSFVGYAALLWLVGRRTTRRLGLRESAEVTLGGAAATRLLPTGGVGGAALTIWSFRRAGLSTRAAARILLAFLVVLYSVFLASMAVAGGLLALGLAPGDGPLALTAVPAIGAVVVIAGALALAASRPTGEGQVAAAGPSGSRLARIQAAMHTARATAGDAVRDAIALVRSGDVRLLGAVAWWAFDAAVLWAMLQALGAPPSVAVMVLAYFVGQIANTIPIPGAASGGLVAVLLAFGVEADLALAAVLAYRSVAIWLPAPIGLVALSGLRRTFARWAEEDASDMPVPAPAPVPTPLQLPAWPRQEPAVQVPGMNLSLASSTHPPARMPRAALLGAGLLAAAAFAAVTAGLVQPPDLEAALTDLSDTLGTWTYALVAALAFLETGAFVGLIAPGETAIVLGGVVAAEGEVSLAVLLPLAWLAAALGDLASFWLGKRLGRRFVLAHGPRLGVTAARLERVEGFFSQHGPKAILAGRFIGIVRAVAPFLAGASGMRLRAFLPWSLLGTAVWATTFTLVGYAFHESFGAAADTLTHGALALAVLAAATLAWRHHRRSAAQRAQQLAGPLG